MTATTITTSSNRIDRAAIIAELEERYKDEGEMTLRRCWYVLLSKGLVHEHPKPLNLTQREQPYKNLSKLLLDARVTKKLPWKVIVDRSRRIDKPPSWKSVDSLINISLNLFRYDPMLDQDKYVEVWVEKDAVSKYVYESTAKWFVRLIVGRGFSSGTYMHNAAERFNQIKKPITILYLSDYDAEGEYFPKQFKEQMPKKYECKADLNVEKLALTKQQVKDWKLRWIWIPEPKRKHMEKQYVLDYWKENPHQKVELDAVSERNLTRVIEKRLNGILRWDIVQESEDRSKLGVTEWKKQHNML